MLTFYFIYLSTLLFQSIPGRVQHRRTLSLLDKKMWPNIDCAEGGFEGQGCIDFLKAHSLNVGSIIVFSLDKFTNLVHVLIFGDKNIEEIDPWY